MSKEAVPSIERSLDKIADKLTNRYTGEYKEAVPSIERSLDKIADHYMQTKVTDHTISDSTEEAVPSADISLDTIAKYISEEPASPLVGKVILMDYDGTYLHEYTKSQWDEVESLPNPPAHKGLIFQEWNWTKEEIDTRFNKAPDIDIVVGAVYITDDGKTRIYVSFPDNLKSPILGLNVNGAVDIDWGDGTEHDILTGTSIEETVYTLAHVYENAGDYVIALDIDGEAAINDIDSQSASALLRYTTNDSALNTYYRFCITKIEIGRNIVRIGNKAFYNNDNLKIVTIPNNVVNVNGDYAFAYCYKLETIILPKVESAMGNYAIFQCNNLKNITIGSGLTGFNSYSIYQNFLLTNITIGDGPTFIGKDGFYSNRELSTFYVPDTVTSINDYAFGNNTNLRKIILPNGLISIGKNSFSSLSKLEEINIPNTVTSIGNYAFSSCASIKKIIVPEGVTSLNENVFSYMPNLEEVVLPDGITSIGKYCFSGDAKLNKINIPDTVTSIGNNAFNNTGFTKFIIPDTVTSIGNYAFSGCKQLEEIVLPSTITSISQYLVDSCEKLEKIIIPNTVTSIGTRAFAGCKKLEKIIFPANVTSLGSLSFNGNDSLKEMHFESTSPINMGNAYFYIPFTTKIYVPSESLETYKTATYWSNFAPQIYGE